MAGRSKLWDSLEAKYREKLQEIFLKMTGLLSKEQYKSLEKIIEE